MPGWVPTGNLNTPRDTHTATKLPNGTVLVHGGRTFTADSTTFLNTSELFEHGTGTWGPTGTAFFERSSHSAILLRNGKVLVVGGFVQARVVHLPPNQPPWGYGTELYDPATGQWESTGPLIFPREYPAVTPLSDGRVLAAGGGDPFGKDPTVVRTAEIYDPVTQMWTLTGSLVWGRRGISAQQALATELFTATLLTSGLVLVVGGVSFYDEAAQTCEMSSNRSSAVVLDASALLALLREEEGAERVEYAVRSGALVSTVNWAEVLARLVDVGGDPEETAAKALPSSGIGQVALVPFDDEQARETARLRRSTRSLGLSLADRAALALGKLRRLPVLTTDRAWRSLRISVKIEVIR